MRPDQHQMVDVNGQYQIRVKGSSSVSLPADRAVVHITIQSTKDEKQSATTDVVASAQRLEALVRQLSASSTPNAPVDHWSRSSLGETMNQQYDHQQQKHLPPRYTAKILFDARFERFQALSEFITSVSDLSNSELQQVEWILLEDTKDKHRSDLRSQAARHAHHKALDYARALGYSKVVPLLLTEGNTSDTSTYRKGEARLPRESESSRKNLAEAEDFEEVQEPSFRYQPEDIKMSLSVEATFQAVEDGE